MGRRKGEQRLDVCLKRRSCGRRVTDTNGIAGLYLVSCELCSSTPLTGRTGRADVYGCVVSPPVEAILVELKLRRPILRPQTEKLVSPQKDSLKIYILLRFFSYLFHLLRSATSLFAYQQQG